MKKPKLYEHEVLTGKDNEIKTAIVRCLGFANDLYLEIRPCENGIEICMSGQGINRMVVVPICSNAVRIEQRP